MRPPNDTLPAAPPDPHDHGADEPARDSQFESFYDPESGEWTLRRIPSDPPAGAVEDDAA